MAAGGSFWRGLRPMPRTRVISGSSQASDQTDSIYQVSTSKLDDGRTGDKPIDTVEDHSARGERGFAYIQYTGICEFR